MYKGLVLDKEDKTNYTNYQSAIIEGLEISGTGGLDAKTPGLATATIEINATGAWIEEAHLEDNEAVGVQLYFVDSSTVFTNLSINNTGGSGTGANGAGISVRSSYFAPKFDGLSVANSTSAGVFAISGGAIQGNDWHLHHNGQEGFYLESAATIVDGLNLEGNTDSGVHIDDARYVFLSNLVSTGNGDAGLEFNRANDIESVSGDVRCTNCTSIGNNRGVVVVDSVDLYLDNLQVHDPITGPEIVKIDNSGLNVGVQGGMFHIKDFKAWLNNSGPAIEISGAEGEIDGLDMYGNHTGLTWDANHNLERNSILSNANLSGSGCLNLSNHDQLIGHSNTITSECTGELTFTNVKLNWSRLTDLGSHIPMSIQVLKFTYISHQISIMKTPVSLVMAGLKNHGMSKFGLSITIQMASPPLLSRFNLTNLNPQLESRLAILALCYSQTSVERGTTALVKAHTQLSPSVVLTMALETQQTSHCLMIEQYGVICH